jgi:hypothetical protein
MKKIALVYLMFGLIIAVAGCSSHSNSNKGIIDTSTPKATLAAYNIGDKVVVGNLTYTVNNIEKAEYVGNQYGSVKANGIFVFLNMTIENNGKDSTTISPDYAKIICSQGRTYTSNQFNSGYLNSTNILVQQIQPKHLVSGRALYDVRRGITCNLQVTDNPKGGNTQLISLGTI